MASATRTAGTPAAGDTPADVFGYDASARAASGTENSTARFEAVQRVVAETCKVLHCDRATIYLLDSVVVWQ